MFVYIIGSKKWEKLLTSLLRVVGIASFKMCFVSPFEIEEELIFNFLIFIIEYIIDATSPIASPITQSETLKIALYLIENEIIIIVEIILATCSIRVDSEEYFMCLIPLKYPLNASLIPTNGIKKTLDKIGKNSLSFFSNVVTNG